MTEEQIIFLILETIGCILVITGYLIKYKQKIQLIAGVCKDNDQIIDTRGFASLVGGNVLLSGIIFLHRSYRDLFLSKLQKPF